MHAEAAAKLRELQTDTTAGVQARASLEAEVTALKARLVENQVHSDEERASLARQAEESAQKAKDLAVQNSLLHSQINTLGTQVERLQDGRIAAALAGPGASGGLGAGAAAGGGGVDEAEAAALRASLSELRQVVTYVRREKDLALAKLEATEREARRNGSSNASLQVQTQTPRPRL